MVKLSENWIVDGLIDFEYKKYIALAYLKEVKEDFDFHKLYPKLSELLNHYNNLKKISDSKDEISKLFPKKISNADFKEFKLVYENAEKESELMSEIQSIIDFAIPEFKNKLNEGKDLYEYIENQLEISPVGINPYNQEEGYLLLSNNQNHNVEIFFYEISIFESPFEKFRGIHTKWIDNVRSSIGNTIENIKKELFKTHKRLSIPAFYHVNSKLFWPLEETLLPISKRMLVKHISTL
ncbi:MAG: hypothetical protein SNJ77_10735 [Cytophagales bacterium]